MNALLNQAATSTVDHTQDNGGGGNFDYEVPPAGPAPARLIGYVELGKRKQKPYQGKEKPDALCARLTFELYGQKHEREVEVNGVKRIFRNRITIHQLAVKTGDRGSFGKLFRAMRGGDEKITHMAQMLGKDWVVQVVHNTSKATVDGKEVERIYANLRDADGAWKFGPTLFENPMTGEITRIPVPEPDSDSYQLLLWDNPTKEQWDSLFIEGTRTITRDGQKVEVSRNTLQEDIVKNATDFSGSALEDIVAGLGGLTLTDEHDVLDTSDTTDPLAAAPEAPAPAAETPKEPAKPAEAPKVPEHAKEAAAHTPEAPAAKPEVAKESAADVLASLGL